MSSMYSPRLRACRGLSGVCLTRSSSCTSWEMRPPFCTGWAAWVGQAASRSGSPEPPECWLHSLAQSPQTCQPNSLTQPLGPLTQPLGPLTQPPGPLTQPQSSQVRFPWTQPHLFSAAVMLKAMACSEILHRTHIQSTQGVYLSLICLIRRRKGLYLCKTAAVGHMTCIQDCISAYACKGS